MRVAVDAAFLGEQRGGDETFLCGLLTGLALRRAPADCFPLLMARDVPADALPVEVRGDAAFPVHSVATRSGPVHFAGTLPRALLRLGPLDLVLSTTHAPLWGPVPSALVLGDLSFVHRPGDYPRATAMRLRTMVPQHLRRARAVLVPSEATRADVLDTYRVDPARVHVVPNRVLDASPGDPACAAALAARGVRGPYLLYVGNLHPRKNVAALIRAFRAVRAGDGRLAGHRLVIAGGRWFGGHAEQDAAAGDPSVVFLGRVTDDERAYLLSHADALAYLSLFEGFGLPPLEAMAYGVPVLTSATTSLPEVCGAAALLVEPADDTAVHAGVLRILTDEALRTRLRAAGPARAASYDTARVGAAALAALRAATGIAADPPRRPPVRTSETPEPSEHANRPDAEEISWL